MSRNGLTEENIDKLFEHAEVNERDQDMVRNLQLLGANVVIQGGRRKSYQVPRKDRLDEHTYQMSRWTPILKDILEDCIDDKLHHTHFPFLGGRAHNVVYHAPIR